MPETDFFYQNIVLVGFMGCGKSTFGRELKRELHFSLLDTDQVIEKSEQISISSVFAQKGEPYFREKEHQLLTQIYQSQITSHIISTGGGTVINPDNRLILKKLGFVVWLRASAQTILERVARHGNRPLLQVGNPLGKIEELLAQRHDFYSQCADLEIYTDAFNIREALFGIVESAKIFFAKSHKQNP